MDILVCPECGGNLQFCAYETIINTRHIDPITGKLKGPTRKVSDGNDSNDGFIECTSCDWQIRDGENGYYNYIAKVDKESISKMFCKINKVDQH